MAQNAGGILSGMADMFRQKGLNVQPQINGNEVELGITADDLQQVLFKDTNPTVRNAVKVSIENNKIFIRIKLM